MYQRFLDLSMVKKNLVILSIAALLSAIVGGIGIICILSMKSPGNTMQIQTSIIVIAAAIVFAVIICLLLGRFMGKILSIPLKMMVLSADKLSVGDLDAADITIHSVDEMGILADSMRKMISSTAEQVNAVKMIADGDLTTCINIRSDHDLLGHALTTLVKNLNDIVVSIISASDQVAAGSSLVSDTSVSLSQGSTRQASSIQELTASLSEIAAKTNLNAQNAGTANELTKKTRINADNSNTRMKEMLGAMDNINESSQNISKIIKVIDDIAFQTNILALNAAVEAARAGQHGKGFSVVAEEVRSLAARSANAAKETTDLIERSIKEVEDGSRIANETAEALSQIVEEVQKAENLLGFIDDASKAQAIGIGQINEGILEVSKVVETNAATSEECAAASEELTAQASQLRNVVGVFRIGHARGGLLAGHN